MRNLKIVLFCITVGTATSLQQEDENRPYEFGFTIDGQQHRHEKKDVNGIIQGEFGFITGDGVYHVTTYATDANGSFKILSTRNIKLSGPLDGSTNYQLPSPKPLNGVQNIQKPVQVQLMGINTKPQINNRPLQTFTAPPKQKPCAGCGNASLPTSVVAKYPLQSSTNGEGVAYGKQYPVSLINQMEISQKPIMEDILKPTKQPQILTTTLTIKPSCADCGYVSPTVVSGSTQQPTTNRYFPSAELQSNQSKLPARQTGSERKPEMFEYSYKSSPNILTTKSTNVSNFHENMDTYTKNHQNVDLLGNNISTNHSVGQPSIVLQPNGTIFYQMPNFVSDFADGQITITRNRNKPASNLSFAHSTPQNNLNNAIPSSFSTRPNHISTSLLTDSFGGKIAPISSTTSNPLINVQNIPENKQQSKYNIMSSHAINKQNMSIQKPSPTSPYQFQNMFTLADAYNDAPRNYKMTTSTVSSSHHINQQNVPTPSLTISSEPLTTFSASAGLPDGQNHQIQKINKLVSNKPSSYVTKQENVVRTTSPTNVYHLPNTPTKIVDSVDHQNVGSNTDSPQKYQQNIPTSSSMISSEPLTTFNTGADLPNRQDHQIQKFNKPVANTPSSYLTTQGNFVQTSSTKVYHPPNTVTKIVDSSDHQNFGTNTDSPQNLVPQNVAYQNLTPQNISTHSNGSGKLGALQNLGRQKPNEPSSIIPITTDEILTSDVGIQHFGNLNRKGQKPLSTTTDVASNSETPNNVKLNVPSSFSRERTSTPTHSVLDDIEVTHDYIKVPNNPPIKIVDKFPGMVDGLPDGITQGDISHLLYKFNYTIGFHGHYEKGWRNGTKIGGYFVNGRDGISRVVTYVADEMGYRPKFKLINLGLNSADTPKEETEKKFGLKSFEFVWYPLK